MPISYKDAGVDIDAGDRLVDRIKPLARQVRVAEVLDGIGGFAGLCSVPAGMHDPVLVSGTDGVGTKLEVAFKLGIHDTVGIDLVAMCVNDIATVGARPLFFLDYFATGHLDVDVGEAVIRGIVEGCRQAGCALLGGETAEMPGMYQPGTYDLAGFAVGVVERQAIIDGHTIAEGDVVIGVASTGIHSNGLSLARRVVEHALDGDFASHVDALGGPVGRALLTPTRIYAKSLQRLVEELGPSVRGVCHVTGGGLPGNLPRILPDGLGADLDLGTYERPALFRWLAQAGPVEESEMLRTFNVGVGLCIVVPADAVNKALGVLREVGETAWPLGRIVSLDAASEPRIRIR
jgi:phosphoribosylformylglycinamidine cyclo-ligase